MTFLSDEQILTLCEYGDMITPFKPTQVKTTQDQLPYTMLTPLPDEYFQSSKIISYGLSSYGYDIRCSDQFKVFKSIQSPIIDPKNFNESNFEEITTDICIIPPNSFVLTQSVEYFKLPRNILGICLGKSTYARCGVVVNITPLEPEWEGHLTIEISNTAPNPVKIYANEGIAQLLFYQADQTCKTSYKDRKGKYQGQTGITTAKV